MAKKPRGNGVLCLHGAREGLLARSVVSDLRDAGIRADDLCFDRIGSDPTRHLSSLRITPAEALVVTRHHKADTRLFSLETGIRALLKGLHMECEPIFLCQPTLGADTGSDTTRRTHIYDPLFSDHISDLLVELANSPARIYWPPEVERLVSKVLSGDYRRPTINGTINGQRVIAEFSIVYRRLTIYYPPNSSVEYSGLIFDREAAASHLIDAKGRTTPFQLDDDPGRVGKLMARNRILQMARTLNNSVDRISVAPIHQRSFLTKSEAFDLKLMRWLGSITR